MVCSYTPIPTRYRRLHSRYQLFDHFSRTDRIFRLSHIISRLRLSWVRRACSPHVRYIIHPTSEFCSSCDLWHNLLNEKSGPSMFGLHRLAKQSLDRSELCWSWDSQVRFGYGLHRLFGRSWNGRSQMRSGSVVRCQLHQPWNSLLPHLHWSRFNDIPDPYVTYQCTNLTPMIPSSGEVTSADIVAAEN